MPRPILGSLLTASLAIVSCGANAVGPDDITSTDTLVRALQQKGLSVTRAGAMPRSAYPFFTVTAQRIVVNNQDVQVFEYPSALAANSDASKVSPTGSSVGQSQVSWMDVPHFYKRDRLLVLFVGHAADVLKVLEAVLGAPFAAGS